MTDSKDVTTPEVPSNATDELWNAVRDMIMPLVQLIAAKKEVFREAACSETLTEIYKVDALRQVEQLSESEVLFCKGLQLFKNSLYVKYVLPDAETKTPQAVEQDEFLIARISQALVN